MVLDLQIEKNHMKGIKRSLCCFLWIACLFFVLPSCTRENIDCDKFEDIVFKTAKMSFGLEGGDQINEIIGVDADYELWAIYDYQNESYVNDPDNCTLKVRIEGRQVEVSLPSSEKMTRWMVYIGAKTRSGAFAVWQE